MNDHNHFTKLLFYDLFMLGQYLLPLSNEYFLSESGNNGLGDLSTYQLILWEIICFCWYVCCRIKILLNTEHMLTHGWFYLYHPCSQFIWYNSTWNIHDNDDKLFTYGKVKAWSHFGVVCCIVKACNAVIIGHHLDQK